MIPRIKESKRILIIGESGRGKTELGRKLSKELNIPLYSTDDFFWEVKFSKARETGEYF